MNKEKIKVLIGTLILTGWLFQIPASWDAPFWIRLGAPWMLISFFAIIAVIIWLFTKNKTNKSKKEKKDAS